MTIVVLVSLVFVVGLGIGIFVFWMFFREKGKRRAAAAREEQPASFSWKYVILPVLLFVFSVIAVAIIYPRLTPEVAYRFNFDGSPRNMAGREAVSFIPLAGQFALALVALVTAWGATSLSSSPGQADSRKSIEKLILVMGNMVAVPQLVIGFVLLDIFSYNIGGRHLMPLWMFALIVMILAGVILAIFFFKTIRRASRGG